jgi:hypothetical protein
MARKANGIGKKGWIGLTVLGVFLWLILGASAISLVIAAAIIGFILFAQFIVGPIIIRNARQTRTIDQLRMTDAVGDALRDYAPEQPSQPSMSARLDDLTAAFQSGRITEDEYNQRRASIIQSS